MIAVLVNRVLVVLALIISAHRDKYLGNIPVSRSNSQTVVLLAIMSRLLFYRQVIVIVYKTLQTHVVAHLEVAYCQSIYHIILILCICRVGSLRNLKVAAYCSYVVFKGGCGRRIVAVVCGTKVAVEHVVGLVLGSSVFLVT